MLEALAFLLLCWRRIQVAQLKYRNVIWPIKNKGADHLWPKSVYENSLLSLIADIWRSSEAFFIGWWLAKK